MVLIGIIPGPVTKKTNVQAYLRHVADQFDGLHDGIMVYDAYEQRTVRVHMCVHPDTTYMLCTYRLSPGASY